MTGKSADCEFVDLEISLLQRMAGKRAATAATGAWVESPVRAVPTPLVKHVTIGP